MAEVSPYNLVTEERVKATLQADKGTDAQLMSWSIVDFTKPGDNFACLVSSVVVKFSIHNKTSEVVYIVKMIPCRSLKSTIILNRICYEKEVKFYLNLVPELNSVLTDTGFKSLRFPKFLYGSLESDKDIILMEDLRAQGFQMVDKKQGLDVLHTTLILEELARLHAASYLLQDKLQGQHITELYSFLLNDWLTKKAKGMEFFLELVKTRIESYLDILKTIDGYENAASWAENVIPKIPDILNKQLSMTKYNVICHGDCWNNNILFRYDEKGQPVEAMLLDLQMNRFASLATDLNYFLFSSLTSDVRKPNLNKFLSIYHKTFSDIMEATGKQMIFTLTQLKDEFRDKMELGGILGLFFGSVIFLERDNSHNSSIFNHESNKHHNDLLDKFKLKTVKAFHTNSDMQSRILSLFDELIEANIIL